MSKTTKPHMKEIIDKTDKPFGYLKNYIIPLIVFICGLSVAWALLQTDVSANTNNLTRLERRVEVVEQCAIDTSERLVRIETQLENILKILDREYNDNLRTISTTALITTPIGYYYGIWAGLSSLIGTYGTNKMYTLTKERRHRF